MNYLQEEGSLGDILVELVMFYPRCQAKFLTACDNDFDNPLLLILDEGIDGVTLLYA